MFKMSNFTNSVFRGPNQVNMMFSYYLIVNHFLCYQLRVSCVHFPNLNLAMTFRKPILTGSYCFSVLSLKILLESKMIKWGWGKAVDQIILCCGSCPSNCRTFYQLPWSLPTGWLEDLRLHSCDKQKCLQILPNLPWGAKPPQFRWSIIMHNKC